MHRRGRPRNLLPPPGNEKKRKCTDSTLLQLVEESLLEPRKVFQRRESVSDAAPFENVDELVLFQQFIECGLTLPASYFLRGLFSFYVHHLNPNSILHLSIFVHFYEAFLGMQPHWNLFCYLFHLKPQPNSINPSRIGGYGFQLNQGPGFKYLEYSTPNSLSGWKNC